MIIKFQRRKVSCQCRGLKKRITQRSYCSLRRYNIRYIVLHAPVAVAGVLTRVFTEKFAGKPLTEAGNGLAYVKLY